MGPQFKYLRGDLWGIELSETIAGLLFESARRYGMFTRVTQEYREEEADYRISSNLNKIEYAVYEENQQAIVDIDFSLLEVETDKIVIHHGALRREPIYERKVGRFVERANEIIMEEINAFYKKVETYFETGETSLSYTREQLDDEARRQEALEAPEDGIGFLLVPALGDIPNQPYYTVYDNDGNFIGTEQIGTAIELPEGLYTVVFGAGGEDQQIVKRSVEVNAQYRTVLEPGWTSLLINIINEALEPVKIRYDIYDAQSGESFGGKISVDQSLGEQQKVWILRPRHYKVTINNKPFNALRDFVTVLLKEGTSEELTIIVATDEEGNPTSLIGAGTQGVRGLEDEEDPLQFSTSVNGNFAFNANNETSAERYATSLNLNSEVETNLIYDRDPLYYQLRNLVGLGFTSTNTKGIRISDDYFQLKNTLIYYFITNLGVYGRLDGATTFFGKKVYPSEPLNYIKEDEDGAVLKREENVDELSLSPPFFPIDLREGLGLNLRAVKTDWLDLNFRTGLGANQIINFEVYSFIEERTVSSTEYSVYRKAPTQLDIGLELSALASIRLPLDIGIQSNFDMLIPFAASTPVLIDWENSVNINIFRYLSIYYKLLLTNRGLGAGNNYLVNDHSVYIRFTYVFR